MESRNLRGSVEYQNNLTVIFLLDPLSERRRSAAGRIFRFTARQNERRSRIDALIPRRQMGSDFVARARRR
jgi:hypothetical protein